MQKTVNKSRFAKDIPKNTQKLDFETRFGLPNPSKTLPTSKKNRFKNDVKKNVKKKSIKVASGTLKKNLS